MRLRRLLGMSLDELQTRGRQEASKWLEPWTRFRDEIPECPFQESLQDAPKRFFEGATAPEVASWIAEHMPAEKARILRVAKDVCEGQFDLLGYRNLDFGKPLDWHRDPVSGRCAPRIPWRRIDPLDPDEVGDSKVIWELNRHQWFVTLGQAYRLTGDSRYSETFAREIQAWLRDNPGGIGINWTSSLEVALRIISWSWALLLFRPVAGPALVETVLRGLGGHALHVERYLSTYYSPNTHLTGEALGLFYAGAILGRGRWIEKGLSILLEQSREQVLEDGVYFEQATCYQRYTVEIGLHLLALAGRNKIAVPREFGERLQALVDFLLHVRRPDRGMPSIGDEDGGWILPLVPQREPDDLRGIFALAAVLFRRSDFAWAAEGPAPEILWLFGLSGLRAFEGLRQAPPLKSPSRLFRRGGYAVMASGWEKEAHHLVLDAGPLGGGHGHADLLSLELSAYGEPYVVDPGTFVYTADPVWRDHFRGTAAHSTVVLDGEGQARPAGPFSWQGKARGAVRHWLSTAEFDYVDVEHQAFRRPIRHRRRVVFVKPRYWVVVDDLLGASTHRFEVNFQLAPLSASLEPVGWVRVRGRKSALLIRTFSSFALSYELHEGETNPIRGWVSRGYGERCPAPQVSFVARAELPIRVFTLLFPVADRSAAPPSISVLPDESGLAFEEAGERLWIVDDATEPVRLERLSQGSGETRKRPCAASLAS